jgi:hypothetical protein
MQRVPMPSPSGTNYARRYLPPSFPFVNEPTMAMDGAMHPMFKTREEAAAYGRAYARNMLGMAFDGLIPPAAVERLLR